MAKRHAISISDATKKTTSPRTFSSKSKRLQPLEQGKPSEDPSLKEQKALFKYQDKDKEAALLQTLYTEELAAVDQSSTGVGGQGSNPATCPSTTKILKTQTVHKTKEPHHRRPQEMIEDSKNPRKRLHQETPDHQDQTQASKTQQQQQQNEETSTRQQTERQQKKTG